MLHSSAAHEGYKCSLSLKLFLFCLRSVDADFKVENHEEERLLRILSAEREVVALRVMKSLPKDFRPYCCEIFNSFRVKIRGKGNYIGMELESGTQTLSKY